MQPRRAMLALIGAGTVTLGAGWMVSNAASVTQLQQRAEAVKALIAHDQASYHKMQFTIGRTMQRLGTLGKQLNAATAAQEQASHKVIISQERLRTTKAMIAATEAQVKRTSHRLQETRTLYQQSALKFRRTERALAHERQLFGGQLRLVEERGSVGYLAVLVGARSFAQFISRVSMLGQIAAGAAREVHAIHVRAIAVRQQENTLAQEKTALADSEASLVAHQNLLNQERAVVQQAAAAAVAADAQATSQARSVSFTIQQERLQMQTLRNQQAALLNEMSSLRGEVQRITSKVSQLMQAFSSGSLSREQLYRAMYPVVAPIAAKFNLSPALVIAVITEESGGHQSAISVTGAIGLMQLEPGTAAALGINPYNPEQNVLGGSLYLSQMLQMFNGHLSLALAAYNAGPGAVQKNGLQVPSYCQGYVNIVESLYHLYSSYPTP